MKTDIGAERREIDRVVEGKTLCSAFAETAARHAGSPALKWRDQNGAWWTITWQEYRDQVRDVAMGLRALGLTQGAFGVIMARNSAQHVIADLGIIHARGTPVSLYNTLAPEQIAYIANHCDARVAFVEDADFLEKFLKIRDQLPSLEHIVTLFPTGTTDPDIITWDALLALGREQATAQPDAFDEMWKAVEPDDLLTLIYTSGTTGPPKGVMDAHRNVLWTVESFSRKYPAAPGDRLVSYLPLAHAAERFLSHWLGIVYGTTTYFCSELTELLVHLQEVRPTIFVGVPRVWEKLYAGITAALASESDLDRRAAIEGAIDVGRQVVTYQQKGEEVPNDLVLKWESVKAILGAIRAKVGLDECSCAITGAAPISTDVIEFFHALGLQISEVWGMSELTAPATWNGVERIKIGSVGRALPGVAARIDHDRELLVQGGNVMRGYYKEPEMTAEALDQDGWLRTGDVADVDDEGYFRIVDRKKELIITAGGKNISPANLENLLKQHTLIGQACVIGDRRPYLSALIVLDQEVAPGWARARGLAERSVAELATHPDVVEEVERAVGSVNQHVSRAEQIRRFTILSTEWTAESEELTPTLKLKRRVVNTKYEDVIEGLYE